ncbi:decaprenyl-phosphate phosphoribosyltransferase [Aureivirga sp. CE67]|uniref:decaprenyl-phosphate phosphoribosyltransferase n=1 Tax=Aureivirga sp. CE67 TaxID=1788983 RepID=UPI0018CA59B2|nr:decaprenyl-phosphate phosphoribosyltransferase [Aureivirga sp. CE67]
MKFFTEIFKLIRVKQWIKNLFIFMPAFFAGSFFEKDIYLNSIYAFLSFCIASSSIYILNDYVDIEKDKLHPKKRFRPLASGTISKTQAKIIMGVLLSILALFLFVIVPSVKYIIIGYIVLNIAYSFKLKHIAIIDILIIATGFVLRVFAGGFATGIEISKWLILLTFFLSLILALAKRRGEIHSSGEKSRTALKGYSLQFIDILITMMSSITFVSYIMYVTSDDIIEQFKSDYIFISAIFVLLGILRYLQQTILFNNTESPTKVIYKDGVIQSSLILWILFFCYIIYF